jgi:hypothetical protein
MLNGPSDYMLNYMHPLEWQAQNRAMYGTVMPM